MLRWLCGVPKLDNEHKDLRGTTKEMKLDVAEIRMLRWLRGITKLDNEHKS